MRILRLSYRIPPEQGGKERHVFALSAIQAAGGDQVSLVFARGADVPEHVNGRRVRGPSRPARLSKLWFAVGAAARLAFARGVDVVHLHGDHVELAVVGPVARIRRLPLVLTVHGALSLRQSALSRHVYAYADHVIALGQRPATDLEKLGVPSVDMTLSHSGLDLDQLARHRTVRNPVPGRLVTVGTLDVVKGHRVLIGAVRTLADQGVKLELHVVGEGVERERLERLAAGHPAIVFRGQLSKDEVYEVVATSDLFVLASWSLRGKGEGVPTAALEAMAIGTPTLLSTDASPVPAIGDPAAYLSFRAGDQHALTDAIRAALGDRHQLHATATRATKASALLGWDNVAQVVNGVYARLGRGDADTDMDLHAEPTRVTVLEVTRTLNVGGVETLLASRLAESDRQSFAYSVLTMQATDPVIGERLRACGVPYIVAGRRLSPRTMWRFLSALHSHEADVVSVHSPLPAVLVRLERHLRRRPAALVTTVHSTDFHPAVGWLDRITTARDETTVAVSQAVRRSLSPLRRSPQVRVAGVDVAGLQNLRTFRCQTRCELSLADQAFVVTIVAGLRRAKNHGLALEAFTRVVEHDPEAILLVVGDGPLRVHLEQHVQRRGLTEHVRLLGRRPDAARIIAASDVLLLSSHHEGLPVVVMEALAAGVPVVSTDVGGVRELVDDGVTGRLVPAGDAAALSEAIRTVPDPRTPEAANAFAAVRQRLDIRDVAAWYEQRYRRATVGRTP